MVIIIIYHLTIFIYHTTLNQKSEEFLGKQEEDMTNNLVLIFGRAIEWQHLVSLYKNGTRADRVAPGL